VYDQTATPLAAMQAFELSTWMPENLMMKADKVLMAHSLEGRFPFLDLDLYRFAQKLPAAMKLPHAGSSKHVLRELLKPQLPASVIERRKMGFTVPTPFSWRRCKAACWTPWRGCAKAPWPRCWTWMPRWLCSSVTTAAKRCRR
jgi:asparagine synthetase B (glutamine-hydrolysing)